MDIDGAELADMVGMEKWPLELPAKWPLLLELAGGGRGADRLGCADDLCELSAVGRFVDRDRREVGSKSLEEVSARDFGGSGRGLAMTPEVGKVKSPGMERSPGMDKLAPGMEGFDPGMDRLAAGMDGFDSSLDVVGLATENRKISIESF